MRIAIIGAGIAGLVAAVSLQRDGHDVTVYEQRRDPNADGAGLTLFGNALAALDAVQLGDTIRAISHTELAHLKTGQRTPDGAWLLSMPRNLTNRLYSIHRMTLHATLMELLTPGTVHFGTQAIVATDARPHVDVDGVTHTYDLVLAADGLRSRNRSRLGLDTGIAYSGYTAWRGVTQRPVDIAGAAAETWGRGKIFGYVPLPDHRLYWFGTSQLAAETPLVDDYAAVTEAFATWHAPISACIAATDPEAVLRHDVYDLRTPLRAFHSGSTALLGDAAHAMLPNLGQGAGQGIEDAVTLTLFLRGVKPDAVAGVLQRYTRRRRRRTTTLWWQSRAMAKVAQAEHPVAASLRNLGMRITPPSLVGHSMQRLHRWDLNA